jgi:alanyl-tRNA synthetase
MLGNWSFGDYYKREAIRWAWELLTVVWELDKSRLHATVFGGDPESGVEADEDAFELWRSETDIDPAHIHRFGKKDNFWMMGETGPCGPCSEIHYDRTPAKEGGTLVNAGDARVIEIWNLVFIQYNQDQAGELTLLPAKHVDTGMGFERIVAVLQGKGSNYDTDVFGPIIRMIADITGKRYSGKLEDENDIAFRVIADHLRMATLAITDGALPSNKDRGYVLRSIIRRAVRFGWQVFKQREPFIYRLVPALVAQMTEAFPELMTAPNRVAEIIRQEEADFLRTIERGISLFAEAAWEAIVRELESESGMEAKSPTGYTRPGPDPTTWTDFHVTLIHPATGRRKITHFPPFQEWNSIAEYCKKTPEITGADMFELHTTHGFPPDLIEQMARERGLKVDQDAYKELMKEHAAISKAEGTVQAVALNVSGLPAIHDDDKWRSSTCEGRIIGWVSGKELKTKGRLMPGTEVGLLVDPTCFYAEAGGQVGDQGSICAQSGTFLVEQTAKSGAAIIHIGHVVDGYMEVGQMADLAVSPEREFTRKNHTATHLLHWALQRVLGSHVEQRGSKVKPDGFTFDFSHPSPMTELEKNQIERLVNEKIYEDLPVQARELPIAEARKLPGVRAFFGDKYGDVVRVIEIGDGFSREFCGGTHLSHTGRAGFFKIVGEEGVAKGVRRLTCVTARQAVAAVQEHEHVLNELTSRFRCRPEELPARLDGLQEEIKRLEQQIKKGASADLAGAADRLLAAATEVNGARMVIGEMPTADLEQMRQQVDRLRQKAGSAVVVIGWTTDGRVQLLAGVTEDLVKRGVHAGKLVSEVAKVVGGSGGGKPSMAQAGGKEPSRLGEALELARRLAGQEISR